MKRIIASVIVATGFILSNPVAIDAEPPIKALGTLRRIEARESSNVNEAQSLTGRWAPEATPDHIEWEKVDDEISENFDTFTDVVYAEAGNQGDRGMRLVADCIINRMRCGEAFDDTMRGVLTAPNQFACVTDGGAAKWRGHEKLEVRKICQEELMNPTDPTIYYFRTGHYGVGKPAYKYKDHYFSRR